MYNLEILEQFSKYNRQIGHFRWKFHYTIFISDISTFVYETVYPEFHLNETDPPYSHETLLISLIINNVPCHQIW
jgi:hypothetical protein